MPRRSRPRAYLLLARVSNLPTVWTNALAAHVAAGATLTTLPVTAAAVSAFYMGGMFLNDVFDTPHDAVARPDRPIPNRDVSRVEAFAAGAALLASGLALLLWSAHARTALPWGAALIAAIVIYDMAHKGKWYGPIVMGLCRALVYGAVAAAAAGAVGPAVAIAGLVMWAYIIALTWVAKAADLGYAVPWMLAGICVIDAVMIAILGAPLLAVVAVTGFVATLALQRVVPGT